MSSCFVHRCSIDNICLFSKNTPRTYYKWDISGINEYCSVLSFANCWLFFCKMFQVIIIWLKLWLSPCESEYFNIKIVEICTQRMLIVNYVSWLLTVVCYQIGSLKGYYLFEHQRVHKRSVSQSHEHHAKLESEPEVSQS